MLHRFLRLFYNGRLVKSSPFAANTVPSRRTGVIPAIVFGTLRPGSILAKSLSWESMKS